MDETQGTRQQGHVARVSKQMKDELRRATLDLMAYSSSQVADVLQVSKLHVVNLITSGKLVAYKEGMEWRVPYRELRAYQERKAKTAVEDHERHSSAVRRHLNLPHLQTQAA